MANRVDFGFTQREGYEFLREMVTDSGLETIAIGEKEIPVETFIQWLDHKTELLDNKKSSGEKKPTAKQLANEGYKDAIVDWMEPGRLYLAAEIAENCPLAVDGEEVSKGTVTALLTQLWKAERIVRTTEKGKNYYSLPAEDAE